MNTDNTTNILGQEQVSTEEENQFEIEEQDQVEEKKESSVREYLYKVRMIASHNSELSNYVEQPFDKDVLFFSGTNGSGKSSKINFYKFLFSSYVNFARPGDKINNAKKNENDSFKYYFPEDNSFWVSEHENPDGVFCQILYRSPKTDNKVDRAFVPVEFSVVRDWLFQDGKSTKITRNELLKKVKEVNGFEVGDQKRIKSILFFNDSNKGAQYNIVSLRNKTDEGYKDFLSFFDYMANGLGHEELPKNIVTKRVNQYVNSEKRKMDSEKNEIDANDMIETLREKASKIEEFEIKESAYESKEAFFDKCNQRDDIAKKALGLAGEFLGLNKELNELERKYSNINGKKRTNEGDKEREEKKISDLDKQIEASEKQRDTEIEAIEKNCDKDVQKEKGILVDNQHKLSQEKLQVLNGLEKVKDAGIKDSESNKNNEISVKTVKLDGDKTNLKTTFEADLKTLERDKKEEIESSEEYKSNSGKLAQIEKESETKKSESYLEESKENKKLQNDFDEKIADLEKSIEKFKNEKNQEIESLEKEEQENEKKGEEINVKQEILKQSSIKFGILENEKEGLVGSIKNYNKACNGSYEIASSEAEAEEIKRRLNQRKDSLVRIVDGDNEKPSNSKVKNLKTELKEIEESLEDLENELRVIENPERLTEEEEREYNFLSLTLKKKLPKQNYKKYKTEVKELLGNFNEEDGVISFAGVDFGRLTEVEKLRDIEIVKKEINETKQAISNNKVKLNIEEEAYKKACESHEEAKKDKASAEKELVLVNDLLNKYGSWSKEKENNYSTLSIQISNCEKEIKNLEKEYSSKKSELSEKTKTLKGEINNEENIFKIEVKNEKTSKEEENKNICSKYKKQREDIEKAKKERISELSLKLEDLKTAIDKRYKELQEKIEDSYKNKIKELDETFKREKEDLEEKAKEKQKEIKEKYKTDKTEKEEGFNVREQALKAESEEKIKTIKEAKEKEVSSVKKGKQVEIETLEGKRNKAQSSLDELNKKIKNLNEEMAVNQRSKENCEGDINAFKNSFSESRSEQLLAAAKKRLNKLGENGFDIKLKPEFEKRVKSLIREEREINEGLRTLVKKNLYPKLNKNITESLKDELIESEGQNMKSALDKIKKKLNEIYHKDLDEMRADVHLDLKNSMGTAISCFDKINCFKDGMDSVESKINKELSSERLSNIKGFEIKIRKNPKIEEFLLELKEIEEEDKNEHPDYKTINRRMRKIEDGVKALFPNEKDREIKAENLIKAVDSYILKTDGTKEKSGSEGTDAMFNILFVVNAFREVIGMSTNFTMPIVIDEVSRLDDNNVEKAVRKIKSAGFPFVCASPKINLSGIEEIETTDIHLSTCYTEDDLYVTRRRGDSQLKTYFVSNAKDANILGFATEIVGEEDE